VNNDSNEDRIWEKEYEKLLDKKNPLDNRILELAKIGKLKIGIVEVKAEIKDSNKKYSRDSLSHKGKHTS